MKELIASENAEISSSIKRCTPRDLINQHIQHPEKSITSDDIENLVLGVSFVNTNFSGFEKDDLMVVV